jgi:TonB family protein
MGYQALLFCPDEKLSIVVSQLFGELDFSVEVVHEPFAAVKKLMAQHYDAIVVDSENEQNASLLFKSARNSSSNHSALAIAMVAGQAGITKAYRIGANLVLTKPINVEQTKGTLRVARGLLRKTSEAAGVTTPSGGASVSTNPASPNLVSAAGSGEPDRRKAPRLVLSSSRPDASESGSSLEARFAESPGVFPGAFPETTATATVEDKTEIATPAATSNRITIAPEADVPAGQFAFPSIVPGTSPRTINEATANTAVESGVVSKHVKGQPESSLAGSATARGTISAFPSSTGSATAPASAPEITAPVGGANRIVESEPAAPSHQQSGVLSRDSTPSGSFSSEPANDSPLFAGISEDSDGLSANKKMLIAAVIVLVLAALVYLGYGLIVKPKTTGAPQSVNLPQDSQPPNPGSDHPVAGSDLQPSAMAAPPAGTQTRPTVVTPSLSAKSSPTASSGQPLDAPAKTPVISIAANTGAHSAADGAPTDQLEIAKPVSKPLRVKSNGRETITQAKEDESAPQLSATVASASENNLSSIVSSGPSSAPKLSLSTLKISQGVSEGLLIKRIEPKYPRAALLAHAQGAVQIEATINKEGFVKNAKVLKGDPVLARAALEAVSQWRYKPYYLDGTPVEIQTQITVNFRPN